MRLILIFLGVGLTIVGYTQNKRDLRQIIKTEDTASLKAFIDQGFDINSNYNKNTCLLNKAILQWKYDLVKFIMNQNNIQIQRTQKDGFNTLHYLVGRGWYDLAEKAIDSGVDPNTLGYKDSHILTMILFNYQWIDNSDSSSLNFIRYLYANGIDADLSLENLRGQKTMLILCAAWADRATTEYFFKKDESQLNSADDKGRMALHYAAKWEKAEAVNYLIEQGANIDAADNRGNTPLDYALKTKNERVIMALKTTYDLKH